MIKNPFIILLVPVFYSLFADPAIAVTLTTLLDGTNLLVTDKRFTNFNLEIEGLSEEQIREISDNIDVDPINDPLNPGLSFNAVDLLRPFIFETNDQLNIKLSYSVEVTDINFEIKDFGLQFDGVTTSGGSVRIEEIVTVGEPNFDLFNPPPELVIGEIEKEVINLDGGRLSDSMEEDLSRKTTSLNVGKSILLRSLFNNDRTGLTEIRQTFSQSKVPEPTSTLSLLALGTLGAASALKRKQKQKSTEKETTKVG